MKMKLFLFMFMLLFPVSNLYTQWLKCNNGLFGGKIIDVVSDGKRVIAGTMNAGVFVSTNKGQSWSQANNGLESLLVTAMAVNEGKVYITTQLGFETNGGIYVLKDNEDKWELLDYADFGNNIAIDGPRIFITEGREIKYSTDYGLNWSRTLSKNIEEEFKGIAVKDSVVIVGVKANNTSSRTTGIYVSKDTGRSWKNVTEKSDKQAYSVVFYHSDIIANSGNCLIKSTDNGETWSTISNGPVNAPIKGGLKVIDENIYACNDSMVYVSADGGNNWKSITNKMTDSKIQNFCIDGIDIYAGTNSNGIFISSIGGKSWKKSTYGLDALEVRCLENSNNTIFAGTFGEGVFRSDDNGGSWTQVNKGLKNTEINALVLKGNKLFAGTSDSGIYVSTDKGDSWQESNTGLTRKFINCFALMGDDIFVGTYCGGVFISTDEGHSWAQVKEGLTSSAINCLAVKDSIIFAGTQKGLFCSDNKGKNWNVVREEAVIDDIIIIGENLIYNSEDGLGLYLSTDNGKRWQNIYKDILCIIRCIVSNNTDLLLQTWDNKIYLSKDKGFTWRQKEGVLPETVCLKFAGSRIFAGTYGQGVYRADTDYMTDVDQKREDIVCSGIYPNPAEDYFKFPEGTMQPDIYTITGLTGDVVQTGLVTGSQVSVSSLAPGQYIVRTGSRSYMLIKI